MPIYICNKRVAWLLPPRIGERFLRGVYVLDDHEWKIIEAILKSPEWRTGKLGERRRLLH